MTLDVCESPVAATGTDGAAYIALRGPDPSVERDSLGSGDDTAWWQDTHAA